MMARIKAGLISLRDLLATAWWVILIAGIGFVVAARYVQPAPPKHVIISAGVEGGAYYAFAGRYAAIMAQNGIALEVRPSAGSAQNLQRLEKGEADIAFIQSGTIEASDDQPHYSFEEAPIQSLGSVFYEPVWVFYRGPQKIDRLSQLASKRVAIGQEGSGGRQLAQQLLESSGVSGKDQQLLPLAGQQAADELRQGKIDAAFVIAAIDAPVVQALLRAPGIRLMSFAQADAHLRLLPALSKVVLPHGVLDLKNDFPPDDTVLLAATATLAVRGDLHPAVQYLLLQAAKEMHGKSGFFQKAGEFPAHKDHALPLSDEADHFYKSGPPFLQRYLPFWLAVLAERMFVLLLPLFALLFPLLKVAPALYSWRIRSRIFRLYGELKFLENDLKHQYEPAKHADYLARINAIEGEAGELAMPLAFSDMVYTLREHIDLVRQTLLRLKSQTPS